MPLSGIGLCEAESITPRSALVCADQERDRRAWAARRPGPRWRRRWSGPATTAASSISPLARGSRPTIASGWWLLSRLGQHPGGRDRDRQGQFRGAGRRSPARVRRRCRRVAPWRLPFAGHAARSERGPVRVREGRRERPGRPRERGAPGRPSDVRALRSALRVLRSLTGLLETVLLALLDPGVTGEEAGLLQRRAVVGLVRRSAPGRCRDAARRPGR